MYMDTLPSTLTLVMMLKSFILIQLFLSSSETLTTNRYSKYEHKQHISKLSKVNDCMIYMVCDKLYFYLHFNNFMVHKFFSFD